MKKDFDLKKDIQDWWSSLSDKKKKFHKIELAYMAVSILVLFSPLVSPFTEAYSVSSFGAIQVYLGALTAVLIGIPFFLVTIYGLRMRKLETYDKLIHSFFFVAVMSLPLALIFLAPVLGLEDIVTNAPDYLRFIALIMIAIGYVLGFIISGVFSRILFLFGFLLVGIEDQINGIFESGAMIGFLIAYFVLFNAFVYFILFILLASAFKKFKTYIHKIRKEKI